MHKCVFIIACLFCAHISAATRTIDNTTVTWANVIAASSSGDTIIQPASLTSTLSATIAVNKTNITIKCGAGSVIQKGMNGPMLTVLSSAGNGLTIDGCDFNGRKSLNYTGEGISISNTSNIRIQNSKVRDNLTNWGIGMGAAAVSDVRIDNCEITGNVGQPIWVQDYVSDLYIQGNRINDSGAQAGTHGIMLHTFASGGTLDDIFVIDNVITHGADNFCIEAGDFGGASPTNIFVYGNHCTLLNNTGPGMVSFDGVTGGGILFNTLNAGGYEFDVAAFEVTASSGVEVSWNDYHNPKDQFTTGLTIDGASSITADYNVLAGGIYVGSSNSGKPNTNSNFIRHNTVLMPPSATTSRGAIWVQNNVASGQANSNTFSNNTVHAPSSIAYGMVFENNVCASATVNLNSSTSNAYFGTNAGHALNFSGCGITNTTNTGNTFNRAAL